jgi:carboxynorspermidine decarboxylase
MHAVDDGRLPSPCFVIDRGALRHNLRILADVQRRAECRILLALKGFAAFSTFPLIRGYLPGVAASSVDEARLGREEFAGEVHTYAPAYSPESFAEILELSDHVVFNSTRQWQRYKEQALALRPGAHYGVRVNPEHSEVKVAIYDPCAPGSRLGCTTDELDRDALDGLTGLHFHTLCELGADALERTLVAVEAKFGDVLPRMKWVNFGGGHHITRPGYDTDLLVRLIRDFKKRWQVEVILEPGEAIAIRTGILIATVLDVGRSGGISFAVLDVSATNHMPDVLEMPYRPDIVGAGLPDAREHTYRLGGLSCLAGDVIGDYSFDAPLTPGRRLVFLDMSHYSMVKTTNFNGVRLPSIALYEPESDRVDVVRRFGYESYKSRLS